MNTADAQAKIVQGLASGPARAEALRARLGMEKPIWQKATAALVASGRIKKSGERRTTEFRLA